MIDFTNSPREVLDQIRKMEKQSHGDDYEWKCKSKIIVQYLLRLVESYREEAINLYCINENGFRNSWDEEANKVIEEEVAAGMSSGERGE